MKKIILSGFLILILSKSAFAVEEIIAHGENPKGKTYFAANKLSRLVPKNSHGWQDNSITNGIFEVAVIDGKLDVRFVDTSKGIKSALAQGGKAITFNKGKDEVSVLVIYPAETIEIYTFYIDKDGQKKFILTQAKSGENALITQSSIFIGSCDFIYFDKFPE